MSNGGQSQIIIGVTEFYFPSSCSLFHQTYIEERENDFIDDYGFTAHKGEVDVKGHFYFRLNLHDMTFTMNEKKFAVIYVVTVFCICCKLENRRKGRKHSKM